MMYSIKCGNVPDFTGDHHDLVYLASTTQKLVEQGLTLVFTDRNAVLDYTDFGPEASSDHLVDWDLMTATWWYNTTEEPDRKERRMAECLVSPAVPFNCILFVATYSTAQEARVREILVQAGQDVEVGVRPDWYF